MKQTLTLKQNFHDSPASSYAVRDRQREAEKKQKRNKMKKERKIKDNKQQHSQY